MNTIDKIRFYFILLSLSLLNPIRVFAAGNDPDPVNVGGINDIVSILEYILGKAYQIFFIAAAASALYSAYMFLATSESDDRLSNAKQGLYYTIVAIIIALLSFALDNLILSIINSGT